MKGVEPVNLNTLVTTDEQTAHLIDLLGKRFTNHGQLLLPTFRQYELLDDDLGLQSLTKDMYRWLGYKPHSVNIAYGTTQKDQQPITVSPTSIIIDPQYKGHPFVIGGMLAIAVLQQIMQKHHEVVDPRFIENATIQTGLGLWVINAFRPRVGHHQSMYHLLDGSWTQHDGLQLTIFTKGQYLQEFTDFTSRNRIFPEDYIRGVGKRTVYLLPSATSNEKAKPLSEPTASLRHMHAAKMMWAKLIIIALTISLVAVFGTILWVGRPHTESADQVRDYEGLSVIKKSLGECLQHATDQLSTYDPNDSFLSRQVDATKSRCESLRNQYNDALSTYQDTYLKPN